MTKWTTRDEFRERALAAEAERDEEHGWAVIATERAQRVEAERDALQAECDYYRKWSEHYAAERDEAIALLRRARKHYTIGLPLDEDIKDYLARLDAAAEADRADS